MSRISMHGLRIDYSADALPSDPLGGFFDRFPIDASSGAADLTIELVRAREVTRPDVEGGRWSPFFFHGIVQFYRSTPLGTSQATPLGTPQLVAWNGSARADIARGARAIRAEIPVADDGSLPEFTEGLIHAALLWALRARRLFDLHAAAVVSARGAPIVIAGDSGAGKTTLMLALVEAGFGYLGDDRVLLRRDGASAPTIACSYPRTFHVGAATLRAFPRLATIAAPPSGTGQKRPVDPAQAYPTAYRAGGAPPSLLLFPRIGPIPKTEVRSLSQAEAFGQLLDASAILAVEGMPYRDENIAALRDLVAGTPCFEVVSGYDVLRDPTRAVGALEPIEKVRVG